MDRWALRKQNKTDCRVNNDQGYRFLTLKLYGANLYEKNFTTKTAM